MGFDPQQLRDLLTSTSSPVIVAVRNTHQDGSVSLHFVLVTGIDGNTFYINDPGYSSRTTLNAYGNDFELRGYVSDPPNDLGASLSHLQHPELASISQSPTPMVMSQDFLRQAGSA